VLSHGVMQQRRNVHELARRHGEPDCTRIHAPEPQIMQVAKHARREHAVEASTV
jgi:hypothetical protein